MLQCVAVCCSVMQCFEVCCSVLECVSQELVAMYDMTHPLIGGGIDVALCCSVLQWFEVFCNVLQCVAVCFPGILLLCMT